MTVTEQIAEIEQKKPFLSKWDWGAFWVAMIAAFAVYFYTLAPTTTLEDAGELAVAGDYLGVPHPPGYPLWTILAYAFSRVFAFVKTPPVFDAPNPAWAQSLMSAVFGALAAGITALLICRSGRDMLKSIKGEKDEDDAYINKVICFAAGVSASLMFAFSPVMWSQCVIVEVYSLNAFFVALILMLIYAWLRRPSDVLLYAIALAFGLGLGNWWPSVLLTLGPIVLVVMLKDYKLFRDFSAVGGVIFGLIVLNLILKHLAGLVDEGTNQLMYPDAGKWLWTLGPRATPFFTAGESSFLMKLVNPFWIYFVINCIAIALGWIFLPRGKTVAITIILVEVGLLIYLYMPIVSDLRNPPMNWGYPRTWEGFMHAITRGQYEKIKPTDVFTAKFIHQLGFYMSELRSQFTLPVAAIGFLPFAAWSVKIGKKRISAMLPALGLAAVAVLLIVLEKYGIELRISNIRIYMLLLLGIMGLLLFGFVGLAVKESEDLVQLYLKPKTDAWEKSEIIATFVVLFVGLLYCEWKLVEVLKSMPPEAPGISRFIVVLIMAFPPAVIGFVAWLIYGGAADMKIDISTDSQKWIILTWVAFMLMSAAMVIAANPRGDIQDQFIQRVKFITSHALYAFWIGYGMILALGYIMRMTKGNTAIAWIGFGCMLAMPLFPIIQNAPFAENDLNRELLRVYGGTNQRGHDFGWQFGNYQLRGINAIREELREGEEPPPSNDYPPEMGPDAIFFGGTDPGRFVPTYMIYSAQVRPDVYLITQNALADHTYMSVMRDLYGEQIWIPAVADNNEAFRQYHADVQAGRRPGNIDLRSGRLVVQGVEHVMAINGILCKMLHDRNKWKHDFYVEESYVIPWMYPYMEPHGLILKINKEPMAQIPPEIVKKDMEFWGWYTARLTSDPKFIYDAVANKSFSKLRSALAGLYEYRNLRQQAETAYKQAIDLCPVSPEAHFRLAGMYMRYGRLDDALQLMQQFKERDPNNTRTDALIIQINSRKELFAEKTRLEEALSGGKKAQLGEVLKLAQIYLQIGNRGAFRKITGGIISDESLPPDAYLTVAKMYSDSKMAEDMDKAIKQYMKKAPANAPPDRYKQIAQMYATAQLLPQAIEIMRLYLGRMPVDVRAWHELGVMYIFQQKHHEAANALQQAVKWGGNKAREDIQKDDRINRHLGRPEYKKLLGR